MLCDLPRPPRFAIYLCRRADVLSNLRIIPAAEPAAVALISRTVAYKPRDNTRRIALLCPLQVRVVGDVLGDMVAP